MPKSKTAPIDTTMFDIDLLAESETNSLIMPDFVEKPMQKLFYDLSKEKTGKVNYVALKNDLAQRRFYLDGITIEVGSPL